MERKYLDVVTAGCAIKQLVSNVEGKDYDFEHVPIDIKVSGGLETYNIFLIYEKSKKEEMLNEVKEKFANHDVSSLLVPSENYVQLAFYPEEGLPFSKYKITFSREGARNTRGQIVDCVVDPKFNYIEDTMNRWFAFDEKLEVHKSDDIYQFIDCISKRRVKKEGFVKKLFKSK